MRMGNPRMGNPRMDNPRMGPRRDKEWVIFSAQQPGP
jgi:hypothetical protein